MRTAARVLCGLGAATAVAAGSMAHAQAPRELAPSTLLHLVGFVQNAYFHAQRLDQMPKFREDRMPTQPEVLAAVATTLRMRERPCASVVDVQYVGDSGKQLTVACVGGTYVIDTGRGVVVR